MIRNIQVNEVFGETKKRIFELIGLIAPSTNYGRVQSISYNSYVLSTSKETLIIDNENCGFFDINQKATIINGAGEVEYKRTNNPFIGIRLSGNYSDIKDKCTLVEDLGNGIKVVEYGEYPTNYASKICGQKTYKLDEERALKETGKTYSFPSLKIQTYLSPLLEPYVQYSKRNKYIEAKEYVDCYGNKYAKIDESFYTVEPLRWYVDEKEDYIVGVNTIAGGVPYDFGSIVNSLGEREEFSVDYFVSNKLVPSLEPSVVYDLPEEYIPEIEEEPITPPVQLPNLDNLNRDQLEALQRKVAELLREQNEEKDNVLSLK